MIESQGQVLVRFSCHLRLLCASAATRAA